MNIYIDESGTFTNAATAGKWNAVAALATPETARKKLDSIVTQLRQEIAGPAAKEVKLSNVPEDRYFRFLSDIEPLNVVVFCTATDAGLNSAASVAEHQQGQVDGILKHLDKMKFEGGRRNVEDMAAMLKSLSPQLYVQMTCQINLMFDVVSRAVNYFAQRQPATLREFRWRVDQKNSARPDFENAFEQLSPPLLQSRSIDEPLSRVLGFDYSHMSQYGFPNNQPPEYLKETYGIDVGTAFNIQKIVRGNMKFMDSTACTGIQAVDLVVSGIRRCLRREFTDNNTGATHLGRLMLQAPNNAPPINLVGFCAETPIHSETAKLVDVMSQRSRKMFK